MQNCPNFYFSKKNIIFWFFLWFFCGKCWRGGLRRVKFWSFLSWDICKRKVQNSFFVSAALHCEIWIWNIQLWILLIFVVYTRWIPGKTKQSESENEGRRRHFCKFPIDTYLRKKVHSAMVQWQWQWQNINNNKNITDFFITNFCFV